VPPAEDPFSGVVKAIDTFERIQLAADTAEAQNQAQTAKAGISGAIQVSDSDEQDPDVFKNAAIQKVQSVYQSAIEGARNPRVRQMLQDRLNDDLTRASTAIHLTHKKKQVEVAQGNSFTYLEQAERELSQMADPAEIANKEREMAGHIRDMIRFGAYSPKQGMEAIQSIKERDAFTRAYREIDISQDPLAAAATIQKKYPNVEPAKLTPLMAHADSRRKEVERMREEAEKKVHAENVLADTIDAVNGRIAGQADLDARARARRYTREEYTAVRRAMEEGGTTNPDVYTRLELEIRQGKLTDQAVIAGNNQLDRQAKSTLMGLVSQAKDEKHFSKQPNYEQAVKLIRLAVSPKGQLESLDRVEQQRLKVAYDELWTRADKGEDPIAVAKELDERIAREPTQGEKPLFKPRFQSKQEIADAYRNGLITRDQLDNEALLFRQWEQFNKIEAERAAKPPSSSSQRRR